MKDFISVVLSSVLVSILSTSAFADEFDFNAGSEDAGRVFDRYQGQLGGFASNNSDKNPLLQSDGQILWNCYLAEQDKTADLYVQVEMGAAIVRDAQEIQVETVQGTLVIPHQEVRADGWVTGHIVPLAAQPMNNLNSNSLVLGALALNCQSF